MKNQNTAALYIRVSTSKQEELSPDAQKRLLLEYAKKNNFSVSVFSFITFVSPAENICNKKGLKILQTNGEIKYLSSGEISLII